MCPFGGSCDFFLLCHSRAVFSSQFKIARDHVLSASKLKQRNTVIRDHITVLQCIFVVDCSAGTEKTLQYMQIVGSFSSFVNMSNSLAFNIKCAIVSGVLSHCNYLTFHSIGLVIIGSEEEKERLIKAQSNSIGL